MAEFSLARNKRFTQLVVAKVGNELSSAVSNVALPLVMLALTGDAALAGFSVALTTCALILSQTFGGALVDRWEGSRALRYSSLVQAVGWSIALGGVVVGHRFGVGLVLMGCVLAGVASGLDGPSEQLVLKRVVAREQMGRASAVGQAREATAELSGGPLGGFAYSVGAWVPFVLQIVLNLVAAIAVPRVAQSRLRDDVGSRGVLSEMIEGFRYAFSDRALRGITIVSGISNLPITLMPLTLVFSYQAIGTPPWQIGLIATSFGVGIILGSLMVANLVERFRLGLLGVIAISAFAGGQVVVVFTQQSFWWTCFVFGVSALPLPAFNSAVVAYMNVTTPERLLGRVVAATGVPGMLLMPVGSLMAGVLFARWGAGVPLSVSAGIAIVAAGVMLGTRALREMPRIDELTER